MIKTYYYLTKPGIIYGNAITAIAGFFLASKGHFDAKLFLAMLVGLSFVIASGCVFNNIYDVGIDAKMDRTKTRAMVTGIISKRSAIIFGCMLLAFGVISLSLFTNIYSLSSALLGFVVYVFLYTPLKSKTVYATLIGSIAGAVPPVVGYTGVTNKIDAGAIILFFILVFWQMPHFYAIAIRRIKEYAEAGIPVLPIKSGIKNTKLQMLFYIAAFCITAIMLNVFGYVGYSYLAVAILLGLYWLWVAIKGFKTVDDQKWAKKTFLTSLIVLTMLSLVIAVNFALP